MSSTDREVVIATLNDLLEHARDGERGFQQLAEQARDPLLQAAFARRAERCHGTIDALQDEVRAQGGTPDAGGTVVAALQRGWAALRDKMSSPTDAALAEQALKAEAETGVAYDKAFAQPIAPSVRLLVESQYEALQRDQAELRTLAAALPAAAG